MKGILAENRRDQLSGEPLEDFHEASADRLHPDSVGQRAWMDDLILINYA